MAGDAPRVPFVEYADDKKDPENYVRILCDIKGLKKKTLGKGPANAVVKFDVAERSFTLNVVVTNKGKSDTFEYKIKQLPEKISTDVKKTFWKMKKDEEIIIMLHKVKSGLWSKYLGASSGGLETAEENEPN